MEPDGEVRFLFLDGDETTFLFKDIESYRLHAEGRMWKVKLKPEANGQQLIHFIPLSALFTVSIVTNSSEYAEWDQMVNGQGL